MTVCGCNHCERSEAIPNDNNSCCVIINKMSLLLDRENNSPDVKSAIVQGELAGKSDALHGKICDPPPITPKINPLAHIKEVVSYVNSFYDNLPSS